jgi:hypothetical protein
MVNLEEESCTTGGVRQGDLLSPMLFLLAMEPLHLLFKAAQELGLLGRLTTTCDAFRLVLYADNAALFICPTKSDYKVTNCILQIFPAASELNTNLSKTQLFPIQCGDTNLDFLAADGRPLSTFPYLFLGLPLSVRKPNRAALQPLIQKIGNRLPRWKRNFLTLPRRELLVQSVLSTMPLHYLMSGSSTPGTAGCRLRPKILDTTGFPSMANDW